jgi:hypothetical protein
MTTSVLLVLMSFVWLFFALVLRKRHSLHAAMMAALCLFDVLFPVYLYLTHDWYTRLVVHQELLSFALWAHLILVISLYALYGFQMLSGRQMLQQPDAERKNHQMQARSFVILRLFVFMSGALLIVPA